MTKLLTGATGLLGRYLMRDLMNRGHSLAVLVRSGRRATAVQRIDEIISDWETQIGRALLRPVVLEGDITAPRAGLDGSDIRWLAKHCDQVVHSAARLTFYEKDGEPWDSNVGGTQHVLDVCQATGIDTLHHLSSAYIAGSRTGVVLEDELDVGQAFGNDYERSKVASEKLVRQAKHLKRFTVYRPSIIMGDSQTGFSSTFHGFYTPLRLAAAISSVVGVDRFFSADHMQRMGLSGDEGKNFVPVNWVSAVITTLIDRQTPHGGTYAVVSDEPVSVRRLYRVYQESLSRVFGSTKLPHDEGGELDPSSFGPAAVLSAYDEQLSVYRSYWRDDPCFDSSHTKRRLPYLRCPTLDDKVLLRLCDYALRHKFAFGPPSLADDQLISARSFVSTASKDSAIVAGLPVQAIMLTVTGPGGGCWTWEKPDPVSSERNGRHGNSMPACWRKGGSRQAKSQVRMNSQTFATILRGERDLQQCADVGRVLILGDETQTVESLGRVFNALRHVSV